jgi:organic radical activating enzyme
MTLGYNHGVARPSESWIKRMGEDSIFVAPLDEGDATKNYANMNAAIDSCMKFGYRISIQTHKILGLP